MEIDNRKNLYQRRRRIYSKGNKSNDRNLNRKKATGMDGITSDILIRIFNKFHEIFKAIYDQCQIKESFHRSWKTAKIIPIANPSN